MARKTTIEGKLEGYAYTERPRFSLSPTTKPEGFTTLFVEKEGEKKEFNYFKLLDLYGLEGRTVYFEEKRGWFKVEQYLSVGGVINHSLTLSKNYDQRILEERRRYEESKANVHIGREGY